MVLTVLFCLIILALCFRADNSISNFFNLEKSVFGKIIRKDSALMLGASDDIMKDFCQEAVGELIVIHNNLQYLAMNFIFSIVGFTTAIVQKFMVLHLRDNVELAVGRICIETTIVVTSILYTQMYMKNNENTLFSTACKGWI
mmetsp:Transcript_11821/g.18206  ORF Transcript_11821/g.18206 Transcript_11821/m.18206 type:complete len:143 (+) Transcript_11821:432-860(+)